MPMYRQSAASEPRLDYGTELAIGVKRFDETAPLEPSIHESNAALDSALKARQIAHRPLLVARVELRYAGYVFDQAVRTFVNHAKNADGGKPGAISKAVAPHGITPIIAPRGRKQIPVGQKWIDDVKKSKVKGVAALREASLAPVEGALSGLVAAGASYDAANGAYLSAFATELAERAAHRTHMKHCVAMIEAAFPDDRARQRVVLPDDDDEPTRATPTDGPQEG